MGVIEVEIKTLRGKRPLVFTWENPEKKVVQCVLITCPCQKFSLPETRDAPLNSDGMMVFDVGVVSKIAAAIEKADLVTHTSMDNMCSLMSNVEWPVLEKLKTSQEKARARMARKVKARRLKRQQKRLERKAGTEKAKGNEEDSVSDPEDRESRSEQLSEERGEDSPVNPGIDEPSPEPGSSDALPEVACQEVRDEEDTDQLVTATSDKSSPADTLTSDNPDTSCTGQTTDFESVGKSVDVVDLEDVDIVSASSSSFVSSTPGDAENSEGLMEAIASIFEEYPGPGAKTVDSHSSVGISGSAEPQTSVGRGHRKVPFIRHLTEEERRKMFKFQSDIAEENWKKLKEAEAFLCDVCGKIVRMHSRLQHMRLHNNPPVKNHICEICGKKYKHKEVLRRHMESHSAHREEFTCRYCPRSFLSASGRNKHERRHFEVFPAVCKVCGLKFDDSKSCDRHAYNMHGIELHDDVKDDVKRAAKRAKQNRQSYSVTCEVCNKLVKKSNIKFHMAGHEGKMYTCNICGKVMKLATRYYHQKLHTSKKVNCTVCGVSVWDLKYHMRRHTGEKPIKCRYCDERFAVFAARQSHEVKHTGEKPHKCTICDKSWMDRNCYRTHMQKLHPEEPVFYKRLSARINISQRGSLRINDKASNTTKASIPST